MFGFILKSIRKYACMIVSPNSLNNYLLLDTPPRTHSLRLIGIKLGGEGGVESDH